jgi:hypothetical protein
MAIFRVYLGLFEQDQRQYLFAWHSFHSCFLARVKGFLLSSETAHLRYSLTLGSEAQWKTGLSRMLTLYFFTYKKELHACVSYFRVTVQIPP